MKYAIENLANVADYKLKSKPVHRLFDNDETKMSSYKSALINSTSDSKNLTHLISPLIAINRDNNGTYIYYIEMTYTEVNQILKNDKQALIEIIRKLRTNQHKLKELEKLKRKVKNSLERLTNYHNSLSTVIDHDKEIENTIYYLEQKIKNNEYEGDKSNLKLNN